MQSLLVVLISLVNQLAQLLLAKNATVTLTHSRTHNLAQVASKADILVVAIGRAKFVTADFVKPGAVVIDVGMNRDEMASFVAMLTMMLLNQLLVISPLYLVG